MQRFDGSLSYNSTFRQGFDRSLSYNSKFCQSFEIVVKKKSNSKRNRNNLVVPEFCIIFRSVLGQWSFKKKCFWDLLTFTEVNLEFLGDLDMSMKSDFQFLKMNHTYSHHLQMIIKTKTVLVLSRYNFQVKFFMSDHCDTRKKARLLSC